MRRQNDDGDSSGGDIALADLSGKAVDNVFFKARSTNASRVVNSNQEPTVRATARPASGVSPEIETSSVRLALGRPEVSPIKCDVRECVVRTSDSLENV